MKLGDACQSPVDELMPVKVRLMRGIAPTQATRGFMTGDVVFGKNPPARKPAGRGAESRVRVRPDARPSRQPGAADAAARGRARGPGARPQPPRAAAGRRPETRDRRRAAPRVSAVRAGERSLLSSVNAARFGSNRHIPKPRRTSRANKTAPCQHFTSTNGHTRMFCLLTYDKKAPPIKEDQ